MFRCLKPFILFAVLLIAVPALSSSTEAEKDTIDRALEAIALKRSDLRIRSDLSASPHALPSFLRWMENPLDAPVEVQKEALQLFEVAPKPEAWVLKLAGLGAIDLPNPTAPQKCRECSVPKDHPEALVEALEILLDAVYTATNMTSSIRERIRSPSMHLIEQFLYPDCLKRNMSQEEQNVTLRLKEVKEALGVAGNVDRMAMVEASLILLEAVKKAISLLQVSDIGDEIQSFSFDTPMGLVEVGGKGSDVHSRDAILILELGGDDVYLGKVAAGLDGKCSLVLDLDGNDLYAGEHFTQGSGFWGIGILVDLKGNDTYNAGNCAQGSGLFGVGLLIDTGGNDRYAGSQFVQAASAWGFGGLLDLSGEDVYQCESSGQAFSGVLGVSCLCDLVGNDRYISGQNAPDPREPDVNQSFSQGFSMGMRNLAAGGFSLLADRTGNDHYQCQYFGQGSSYWMGVGLLYDHEGNDTYVARRYAQGAGIHYSFGLLLDAGGNDQTSSWGVSQGCGHDYGIGILINHSGQDTYVSDWTTTGASEANGIGIFVDTGGDDGYEIRSGMGMGHLAASRRAGGVGLFVDAGGRDRYSVKGSDDAVWTVNRWGVGVDENQGTLKNMDFVTGGLSPASAPPPPLSHWDGLEALLTAATQWGSDEGTVQMAQEQFLDMDPAITLPFLTNLLDTPDVLTLIFMEKVFSVHAFHALPRLLERVRDSNPSVRSVALHMLSKIKDPTSIGPMMDALQDPDWRVRSAALRAIGEAQERERFKELLLLRSVLKESLEKGEATPLKEYISEATSPLILSVLVSTVPVRFREYRSFAAAGKPDSDFIDFVLGHCSEMIHLLDRWLGVVISSGDGARAIRNSLHDPDPAVRRSSIYTLGQIQYRPALRDIILFLSDPDPWVRDSAVLALAMFKDEVLPFVRQALGSERPSLIILSLDVLGRIKTEAAKEIIRQYTNHADPNVRRMASSVLEGS